VILKNNQRSSLNVKDKYGKIIFPDYPEFKPNLTPKEIFSRGSFGGIYWKEIYSNVANKKFSDQHLEFSKWWDEIPNELLINEIYDKNLNRFKVSSGTSLRMWESKGWIREQDPYGWVQWYCRFFVGRRSIDDDRQIKRWLNFTGPKGRFKNMLIKKIIANETVFNDESISPVIRQSLQHWAYELTQNDFEEVSLVLWKNQFVTS